MNAHEYNKRVDFINSASRQLEQKLAAENKKLHEMLQNDVRHKTAQQIPVEQKVPLCYASTKKQCQEMPREANANVNVTMTNGNANVNTKTTAASNTNGGVKFVGQSDHYKPVNFWLPSAKLVNFEGPVTRTIPPGQGSIGGSITTWQWTKASERTAASGKPRF